MKKLILRNPWAAALLVAGLWLAVYMASLFIIPDNGQVSGICFLGAVFSAAAILIYATFFE